MKKLAVKRIVYGLPVAVLLALVFTKAAQVYRLKKIDFEAVAYEKMQEAAAGFDRYFSETDSLELIFSKLIKEKAAIETIEKELQKQGRQFNTDGVYITSPSGGNVLFFSNADGILQLQSAGAKQQEWFEKLVLQNEKSWGGPVFDFACNSRVVYCHIPFAVGGERISIICIYNGQKVYRQLHETGLSRFGVQYIMDYQTNFIAHPLDETRSLLELGTAFNDKTLIKLSNDVIYNRPLDKNYRHINTVTKQLSNEKLLPLSRTGWLLGLSVYDGTPLETAEYQKVMRRGYICIICCCAALLLLVCKLMDGKKMPPFFRSSLLYPAVMLLTTVAVVTAYNRFPQQSGKTIALTGSGIKKWEPRRIVDKQSLNGFIDAYNRESVELYNQSAKIIPTGIYIYSVEFLSSYIIKITGTFWQKYLTTGRQYPEEIKALYHCGTYKYKGLFFPGGHISGLEQTDSIDVLLDNYPATLYRWNFNIEIEQQLSYTLYPFGKHELSLTLWSRDLDDNTLITPDLESYRQIYPTDRPGLDNHFNIRGWNIFSSYYSYSMESYLCNFGNTGIYGINLFPELLFNISISRKFINILVCKIILLTVVLVLMFTILFVRVKSDGFNNIIGCSGLFFVLVLDHINLRESTLPEQIIYLEFYYFFSYILLLLITITSFNIAKNEHSYNSRVDKTLKNYFWTIISAAMTAVTIAFFY
jgi:hypothetical protein